VQKTTQALTEAQARVRVRTRVRVACQKLDDFKCIPGTLG
jgi:hypothetical protein